MKNWFLRLFLLVLGAVVTYLALTSLATPDDLTGRIGLPTITVLMGEFLASLLTCGAASSSCTS